MMCGVLAFMSEDYKDAQTFLERATGIDPQSVEAWTLQGETCHHAANIGPDFIKLIICCLYSQYLKLYCASKEKQCRRSHQSHYALANGTFTSFFLNYNMKIQNKRKHQT